jgi:mannose-6-phosphate isomerase
MEPLRFEAYLRPMPWGGRRLESLLGKKLLEGEKYGESWELSGHPHHVSVVAEGPFRGKTLTELWQQSGEQLLGRPVPEGMPFPLLIKFLDCHELLSVQVHPDDETAERLLGEKQGKTEAWVVIEAAPTARIYAGLKPAVTRSDLERSLDTETVAECLHSFIPQPGDCVFLPAGTVHAVGGVLLAEVQQTSDATFRLFDWNRRDALGRARSLHRTEALSSIDWTRGPVEPVRLAAIGGCDPPKGSGTMPLLQTGVRLAECRYFRIDRHCLNGQYVNPYQKTLSIWMVLEGGAELRQPASGYRRQFGCGETVLIPADGWQVDWMPASGSTPTLLAVTMAGRRLNEVVEEFSDTFN